MLDIPFFLLGLNISGGGSSDPMAVADFKNGAYQLNGSATSLAALFDPGGTHPDDGGSDTFAYSQVIPGTGWRISVSSGGLAVSAFVTYALQSLLAARGCTVLVEYVMGQAGAGVTAEFGTRDFIFPYRLVSWVDNNNDPPFYSTRIQDVAAFDYDYDDALPSVPDTLAKLAGTIIAGEVDASSGGLAAISSTLATIQPALPDVFLIRQSIFDAPGAAEMIIEKVTFYAPKASSALPALSA